MATHSPVQLGMVGLGRMGANLVRRAMRDGHPCAGTDVNPDAVQRPRRRGDDRARAPPRSSSRRSTPPRAVWVMVPAGPITERAIAELASLLEPGDTVIDGGNTRYHDDIRRARELAERGIHYVDVGTSGGVFGLERGFCLMVGGEDEAVARLGPLFTSLAPGLDAAERTPGRTGDPAPGGARLAPLRARGRRPLREDGAQRDRIRPDGRLRGRAERPPPRERRQRRARLGRRDRAARRARALPLRPRRRRDRRGVAARERRGVVAARPDGRGARRVADARRLRRARLRLGRGSLDVDRRDRVGHARAGAHRRALRAVLVARRGRVREPAALGDAEAVRRPRREVEPAPSPASLRRGRAARASDRRDGSRPESIIVSSSSARTHRRTCRTPASPASPRP